MNNSGDAAEQIVRMSLQGVEFAARITGSAAKELALLIITALKNENKEHVKLRGKERLKAMLKSGKPLEIYSIKERDLARFSKGAKEYGIVYSVLRNTKNNPDGLCDIMVKADDAPKIARLAERFNFATVDRAKIEREILDSRDKPIEAPDNATPTEHEAMDVADTEKLLDDLLGTSEGKVEPDAPETEKEEPAQSKAEPVKAETEVSDSRPLASASKTSPNQSEPISEPKENSARDSLNKPSVREEIREIKATRKVKANESKQRDERIVSEKNKRNRTVTTKHQQLEGKRKTQKMKGNR
jgi:hypothetical protein